MPTTQSSQTNIRLSVKFFASLRERMGRSETQIQIAEGATVADVWTQASGGEAPPANLLAAVNMEYVGFEQPLQDADEVAFFPPVTGG